MADGDSEFVEASSDVLSECPEASNEILVGAEELKVNSAANFAVGDTFASFEELEVKLKEYEESKCVKLWKRDSRTVQAARKRLNRPLSDHIKYYEVVYCCIHGGKKFKSKGEGKRSCL